MRSLHTCTFLLFCSGVLAATAAALELNGFFPPGGQQGQTVEVRAEGKLPVWPVAAWSSSADLHIAANEKEKGLLSVSISADAVPGRHWIRLHSDTGATRLRPFLVSTAREVLEADIDQGQPFDLSSAVIINGRLSKNDEVDEYRFRLTSGQTLVAALTAHRFLGSPMDAVMQFVDVGSQAVLYQNDDAPGRDPRIVHQVERDGDYAIRLFAFPETPTSRIGFAGNDRFVYRLALTATGFVDYAFPLTVSAKQIEEVNVCGWSQPETSASRVRRTDHGSTLTLFHPGQPGWGEANVSGADCRHEETDTSLAVPQHCDLPFIVSGRIDANDGGDAYCFQARAENRLRITVESRQLGFPLDPVIEMYDDRQKLLVKQDDSGGRDCSLEFKVPADGHYRAVVRDLHQQGGARYVYRLSAGLIKPSFALEVANEVYEAKANEELAIPIQVVRKDGFDQAIQVTASGLPAGTLTSNATSIMKDASEKEVKLTVKATSAVRGCFHIIGITRTSSRHVRGETPASLAGHSTHDLWLTVTDSKAKQDD